MFDINQQQRDLSVGRQADAVVRIPMGGVVGVVYQPEMEYRMR